MIGEVRLALLDKLRVGFVVKGCLHLDVDGLVEMDCTITF